MNGLAVFLIVSGALAWGVVLFYLLERLDAFLMGRKW